ncbi:MAG: hypothetical protein EBR40_05980, partial [Proteobacteria bacterium]|nr:hypothetical protein [Pseudomonadota bacterium]
ALDGRSLGATVAGFRQVSPLSSLVSQLPAQSSLKLSIYSEKFDSGLAKVVNQSRYHPEVQISLLPDSSATSPEFLADLPVSRSSRITLDQGLFGEFGFGALSIENREGGFVVDRGVSLNLGGKGYLEVNAGHIEIDGDFHAPGGTISLKSSSVGYADQLLLDSTKFLNSPVADLWTLRATGETVLEVGRTADGKYLLQGHSSPVSRDQLLERNTGVIVLGAGAVLDTSGILRDFYASPNSVGAVILDGGKIEMNAYRTDLRPGSVVNVSGGASVGSGKTSYGRAGSITISGGFDPDLATVSSTGLLLINGGLKGFSGVGQVGGTISLSGKAFQIGGKSPSGVFALDPSFFNQGGFSSFTIQGQGIATPTPDSWIPAVSVAPGTILSPAPLSQILSLSQGIRSLVPISMPASLSSLVSLSLKGNPVRDAKIPSAIATGNDLVVRSDIVIGEGAEVSAKPMLLPDYLSSAVGLIKLDAQTIEIRDGAKLSAPGGSIVLAAAKKTDSYARKDENLYADAQFTLLLGERALISVSGIPLLTDDPLRLRGTVGTVLAGGSVDLSGNILALLGSIISASGASAELSYLSNQLGLSGMGGVLRIRVDSAGGSIALHGGQMLYSAAMLSAKSGGDTANGGRLEIGSSLYFADRIDEGSAGTAGFDRYSVRIQASGQDLATAIAQLGVASVAKNPLRKIGEGGAYVSLAAIDSGGFDRIALDGNVAFEGISAAGSGLKAAGILKVATGGLLRTDGALTLEADSVSLGQLLRAPLTGLDPANNSIISSSFGLTADRYVAPTGGPGSVTVNASQIDIGNLSLQNASSLSLLTHNGSVRGDGTLDLAGDLLIEAGMVYPASGTTFQVFAYTSAGAGASPGSITIRQSGSFAGSPLSAVGAISLYASRIDQGGTLVAPFGTITLGWNGTGAMPKDPFSGAGFKGGALSSITQADSIVLREASVTSVSGKDSATGLEWTIPFGTSADGGSWIAPGGIDITSSGLLEKSVTMSSGGSLSMEQGSIVDLRGGGQVTAYQWIPGLGGKNNLLSDSSASYVSGSSYLPGDIVQYGGRLWSANVKIDPAKNPPVPSEGIYWTKIPERYAIIPGYSGSPDPAGYLSLPETGQMIRLASGVAGLPVGDYSLLPASYASLPGAYLITVPDLLPSNPQSLSMPDGTFLTYGIRFDAYGSASSISKLGSYFSILPPSSLAKIVEFKNLSAGEFFKNQDASDPSHAADLAIIAAGSMDVRSAIRSSGSKKGLDARIGISSVRNFIIVPDISTRTPGSGEILLDAGILNSWNAGSLLIGGSRSVADDGSVKLSAQSASITMEDVDLTVQDLILAATGRVEVKDGASIKSTASSIPLQDQTLSVAGNGALLRIAGDFEISLSRVRSVGTSDNGNLLVGAKVALDGGSILLDSSSGMNLDKTATFTAASVSMAAGSIACVGRSGDSIALDSSDEHSLIIEGKLLDSLEKSSAVALTSYSTLSLYGSDSIGSESLRSLKLNASVIRGFLPEDGIFGFKSQTILLGNSAGESAPGIASEISSENLEVTMGFKALEFESSRMILGKNSVRLDNFTQVNISASQEAVLSSDGGLYAGTSINLYHPSEGENAEIVAFLSGISTADLVVKDREGVTLSGEALLDLPAESSILIPQITHLAISTPKIYGVSGVSSSINASGALVFNGTDLRPVSGDGDAGLGVNISLKASSVEVLGVKFDLPAGSISVTAANGDVVLGNKADISVRGGDFKLQDTRVTTDAGMVQLTSLTGNVVMGNGSSLDLRAFGGRTPGRLSISAPGLGNEEEGVLPGHLEIAQGVKFLSEGSGGATLDLDLGSLPSFAGIRFGMTSEGTPASMSDAGFTGSISVRVRGGDVVLDDLVQARKFSLSADRGSITVAPYAGVNASGPTGGTISMVASGSLMLEQGASLNVHGETYDKAGKGGSVFLSAGAAVNGQVDQSAMLGLVLGSVIDLGVDQESNGIDQFGGTLHLRAPVFESPEGPDIRISMLDADISGASVIAVEGFRLYELKGSVADLNSTKPVRVDGDTYDGNQSVLELAKLDSIRFGSVTDAILERLVPEDTPNAGLRNPPAGFSAPMNLTAGIEIINREGSIKLSSDWDFAAIDADKKHEYRYGNREAPGFLTLRAAGDLILEATLSDGFAGANNMAILLDRNPDLPVNFQSWSYDLTAGADLFSASSRAKIGGMGDLLLGKLTANSNLLPVGNSANGLGSFGADNVTTSALVGNFQVIRTGSGDIMVSAARDIRFLNQFASIYTAGTKLDDQDLEGRFDLPNVKVLPPGTLPELALGQSQEAMLYGAQFSAAGGNVSILARGNIVQLQKRVFYTDVLGNKVSPQVPYEYDDQLTADSSWQLPTSWLMRRGGVSNGNWNSREGLFYKPDGSLAEVTGSEIMSTSWWVNFANYLGGIATLGGGNVSIEAGGTVANISISLPTQMRATSRKVVDLAGIPTLHEASVSESAVYETGGGDLTLRTGKDLDAGSIYLERGDASIRVIGDIVSNETRNVWSETLYYLSNPTASRADYASSPSRYWAPTAFFQGKGSIDLQVGGKIDALGMPGSVFALPQGYSNDLEYRNYFTTFDAAINGDAKPSFGVTALGGDITLRTKIDGLPTYQAMARATSLGKKESTPYAGAYQPWIRVVESSPGSPELGGLMGLTSPKLEISASAGNVNFEGDLTLYPASYGNLTVSAEGNVSGLSRQGDPNGLTATDWTFSTINLSDADASKLPTQFSPVGQAAIGGAYTTTTTEYLRYSLLSLSESGSYSGGNASLNVQSARHAGGLHGGDQNPLVISSGKEISGIQLFSPKITRVTSQGDIRDVSFYLQNYNSDDISVIRASGNIIPYDVTTESQKAARATIKDEKPKARIVQSGDIQIAGPGTLLVLAGGNIDLGNAPNRAWKEDALDSTIWNGVSSIGNARNPSLPFQGADIVMSAGSSLSMEMASGGSEDFAAFASRLLNGPKSQQYMGEIAESFRFSGSRIRDFFTYSTDKVEEIKLAKDDILDDTGVLSEEERLLLNMNLMFLAIKNAAKDYYDESSPNYKTYREGKEAITKFFAQKGLGDVLTRTRDIRTKNGGNISILAPGGGLTLDSVDPYSKDPPFGIITQYGGGVNILAKESVGIGIGRIFTLRGGDITIWSDVSIAAGASAKTVASAPPTRALVDPQSASVLSDLASLSTGGGIGTLQAVKGVPIADVTLVAPIVDAGDAGIRSSGNLLVAAEKILNADNIVVAGFSVGVPAPAAPAASAPPPAAPPATAPPAAASTAAAANNSAAETASKNNAVSQGDDTPSIYSIDILGYGGGGQYHDSSGAGIAVTC